MAIIFKEDGHTYESIEDDNIKWLSVTSFIGMFKPKFDKEGQAKKSAKNKKSKWYGMTEKEIISGIMRQKELLTLVIFIMVKENLIY